MFRLAVFVSGGGTNLQSIIDSVEEGFLSNVVIDCVIASKPDTYAEVRAHNAGIDTFVVNRKEFSDQTEYDSELIDKLSGRGIDLVVLAGFMCLLGSEFIRKYKNRIINIHPSLIPAFCGHGLYGLRPHQAALEYGVKLTGATVHFVDEEYDSGPILLQKSVPVYDTDTPELLQQRVMALAEKEILPQAVYLLANNKVKISGRRTIILEVQNND